MSEMDPIVTRKIRACLGGGYQDVGRVGVARIGKRDLLHLGAQPPQNLDRLLYPLANLRVYPLGKKLGGDPETHP